MYEVININDLELKVITKVAAGKNDHIVLFHNVLLVAANRILPLSHFKIRCDLVTLSSASHSGRTEHLIALLIIVFTSAF